jgi:sugar/nucleoside kinase (ribokinase family)
MVNLFSVGQTKITVYGNATLDAHVVGPHKIIGEDRVIISDGLHEMTLQVDNPPIFEDRKTRVNQRLDQVVGQLLHRYQPGGGGLNSVLKLREMHKSGNAPQGAGLDLVYIDVSDPHRYAIRRLRKEKIGSNFLYEREIPVNVVLGVGSDRLVLKGPSLGRLEPDDDVSWEIAEHIKNSNAVLVNSAKDPKYAEIFIKYGKQYNVPMFFAATDSLEWEFVYEHILPGSTIILNYDDLAELHGLGYNAGIEGRTERMVHSLATLGQIREERLSPDKKAYVTLGSNGVYCSDKHGISHVLLDESYAEKVDKDIRKNNETTNGAGDSFSAGVVFFETFFPEMSAVDIAMEASKTAIRHIGYKGPLPRDAFKIILK